MPKGVGLANRRPRTWFSGRELTGSAATQGAAGSAEASRRFRVVALMSAFNEGDIIAPVLEHLIASGVEIYLLDHHSSDDTVEKASRFLGRGLLAIEIFPEQSGQPAELAGRLAWRQIILRKEELARELDADWFVNHDADEIRDGPFPGVSFSEAVRYVDRLGYNAIDFQLFNFRPIDDGFRDGDDPARYFAFCERGDEFDRVQVKCWKKGSQPVELVPTGGHDAVFPGRRIFPLKFLLRHYPFRGQTHGERKVFGERKNRFVAEERDRLWHVQYDRIRPGHNFVDDPARLRRFDLDTARLELLVENAPHLESARAASERETKLREELEGERISRRAEVKGLREFIASRERELSELRVEGCQREETHRRVLARIDAAREAAEQRAELAGAGLESASPSERLARAETELGNLSAGIATLRQASAHAYHEHRRTERVLLLPIWRKLAGLLRRRPHDLGEITPGRRIEQRFVAPRQGLAAVTVEIGTLGRANACRLRLALLRDGSGVEVRSVVVEAWRFERDAAVEFRFAPLAETGEYRFAIESPDALPGAAVTLYTKQGEGLTVDGAVLGRSLRYSLSFEA